MKAFLALAAAATFAAHVVAQPRSGSWQVGNDSMHIYYEDLDVNSRAGRAALLARVDRAVARLCRADMKLEETACEQATMAGITLPALRQAMTERAPTVLASR
ncbi:UrcA family protein [Sphingomonas sp. BIUV-7]|uniref:UrcA family protein n=1 Tax=Sphingomonas natans TaxID=3063330 RepID=A0ABT8YDW3_9SPHN|nr:UrcA family protein [Sphingomonas sp. BIUV-7]MDO6415978.1 UrcA family protein [Sphingomonas sp. BIUV-7]